MRLPFAADAGIVARRLRTQRQYEQSAPGKKVASRFPVWYPDFRGCRGGSVQAQRSRSTGTSRSGWSLRLAEISNDQIDSLVRRTLPTRGSLRASLVLDSDAPERREPARARDIAAHAAGRPAPAAGPRAPVPCPGGSTPAPTRERPPRLTASARAAEGHRGAFVLLGGDPLAARGHLGPPGRARSAAPRPARPVDLRASPRRQRRRAAARRRRAARAHSVSLRPPGRARLAGRPGRRPEGGAPRHPRLRRRRSCR